MKQDQLLSALSSWAGLNRAAMKTRNRLQRCMDRRSGDAEIKMARAGNGPVRGAYDPMNGTADSLENPLRRGHMIATWQNGRRVLMHSSEVAKLMRKEKQPDSSGAASSPSSSPSTQPGADESGKAVDRKYDLTPPPIAPRSRSVANNENWQLLAKLLMNACGAPRHCRKPACRRSHRCEGGRGACYLREFETVDVVIRRDLLPALKGVAPEAASDAGD